MGDISSKTTTTWDNRTLLLLGQLFSEGNVTPFIVFFLIQRDMFDTIIILYIIKYNNKYNDVQLYENVNYLAKVGCLTFVIHVNRD